MHISIQQKITSSLCTHCLFFLIFIYFHHQRTHSVMLLCACVSVSKSVVMIRTCRQKKKKSLSFCFLPLCLALAAAATPVCAFVTVATDSKGKARQRCSIAVDLKSKGGGGVEGWVVMGSGWGVVALWHTHNKHSGTRTHAQMHVHTRRRETSAVFIHMSVHQHGTCYLWGGGTQRGELGCVWVEIFVSTLFTHHQDSAAYIKSMGVNNGNTQWETWICCMFNGRTW